MTNSADLTAPEAPNLTYGQGVLRKIARRVLWLSQSSSLDDAYRIHHIDTGSIVEAALTMVVASPSPGRADLRLTRRPAAWQL